MKSPLIFLGYYAIFFILALFLHVNYDARVFASEIKDGLILEKMFLKTDSFGYVHLLGQIKNILNDPLYNVTIEATFYNPNNDIIGKYERKADLDAIESNRTSPFEIIYLDTKSAKNIKNYTLSIKHKEIGISKEKSLTIESVSSRPDISGFFYINGKIKNNGDKHAVNSMISATYYNKDGNVIGISKAIVEPINIAIGKEGGFGLVFVDKEFAFKIKNFVLNAYSDQYISEPFFK